MDQSDPRNYIPREREFFLGLEDHFNASTGDFAAKLHAFTRYVPRQSLSVFLARHKVFTEIVGLHGAIVDFGVYRGSSLFSWLQLSSIHEPYNHVRRIVGFDSFQGFDRLTEVDLQGRSTQLAIKEEGGMSIDDGQAELESSIDFLDLNRPVGHISRASIIGGHIPESVDLYLESHPETMIALANFGLGTYEATIGTLSSIRPHLQSGSILVFEEADQSMWPGESVALREVFEPQEISLRRVPYCPQLSWMRVQ